MPDTRCPLRRSGLTVTGRESRAVLSGPERSLQLNETALAIWDLCDGSTTVDEMVGAVVELTGIDPEQARLDVAGLVDELARLNLVSFPGGC